MKGKEALVFAVVRIVGINNRLAGNAVIFSRPFTQINQLAALAAKRPEGIVFGPDYFAPAGRAVHFNRHYILQQLSRKATSSLICCGR